MLCLNMGGHTWTVVVSITPRRGKGCVVIVGGGADRKYYLEARPDLQNHA